MLARILDLPVFLIFVILACSAMFIPAIHALTQEEFHVARSFFYSGLLGLILCALIGIAMSGRATHNTALEHLLALLAVFVILPVVLAVPFYEALRTTSFVNAYFEMVSSLTTTGATMFPNPSRLPSSLHLWRGIVGWSGGLLMWIAAAAILAPLNLGGFEVTTSAEPGQGGLRRVDMRAASPGQRLIRTTKRLFPIYAGLTLTLWLCLIIAGNTPLNGLMHAMATLSTSGISAIGGIEESTVGVPGEVLVFLFLLFALSRLTFSTDTITGRTRGLHEDAEFRIGLMLVVGVPMLLFMRHWLASFEVNEEENLRQALKALWGGMFTVLSFLTTTGFVSSEWEAAQGWSGLATPGMILMGLALMGGGVATTAGGVKLLRVFTLYLNGLREMQKLIHPSSVSGKGAHNRRVRRQGAYTAWIFFMLFALSLALVTLALTGFGASFSQALVMSVAALSTTGPLLDVAGAEPILLTDLSAAAKLCFAAATILGRLETLAIIALLTPELWRK
ncbi:TrkH family potassium uptake protein [Planktotalea arctica]|uniref:TrkH family potassium uptake protein n=1 Tax=Planktotalea arctica TaxID=1481893 RepID=UPI00321A3793